MVGKCQGNELVKYIYGPSIKREYNNNELINRQSCQQKIEMFPPDEVTQQNSA